MGQMPFLKPTSRNTHVSAFTITLAGEGESLPVALYLLRLSQLAIRVASKPQLQALIHRK